MVEELWDSGWDWDLDWDPEIDWGLMWQRQTCKLGTWDMGGILGIGTETGKDLQTGISPPPKTCQRPPWHFCGRGSGRFWQMLCDLFSLIFHLLYLLESGRKARFVVVVVNWLCQCKWCKPGVHMRRRNRGGRTPRNNCCRQKNVWMYWEIFCGQRTMNLGEYAAGTLLVARNLMSGKGIFPLMSEAMLVLEEIFVTVGWLVA